MRISNEQPAMIEKIIAVLTYTTMGFAGFIWLLIGIFTKNRLRPYLQYHIFQSIFLSIAYFLVTQFVALAMNVLSFIPFVNQLVLATTFYFNMPLLFGASVIQLFVYSVLAYLVFTSVQGKYSYLPWISDIIKANVRG